MFFCRKLADGDFAHDGRHGAGAAKHNPDSSLIVRYQVARRKPPPTVAFTVTVLGGGGGGGGGGGKKHNFFFPDRQLPKCLKKRKSTATTSTPVATDT